MADGMIVAGFAAAPENGKATSPPKSFLLFMGLNLAQRVGYVCNSRMALRSVQNLNADVGWASGHTHVCAFLGGRSG